MFIVSFGKQNQPLPQNRVTSVLVKGGDKTCTTFGFRTVKIHRENSGIEVFCWNNVAYRSHVALQNKHSREVSARLTSHGMLLYCEGWGDFGETSRQIRIIKKQHWGHSNSKPRAQLTFSFKGPGCSLCHLHLLCLLIFLSERQRTDALVYLCHLASSFNLKHLPDAIFGWVLLFCFVFLRT